MRLMQISAALLVVLTGCTGQKQNSKSTTRPEVSSATLAVAAVPVQTLKSKALTTLESSFADTNPYIRNHAIEASVTTSQKHLISYILQRLEDASPAVRFTATVAVGDMDCQTCQDALTKMMADENPNIHIAAAYAMIKLGDSSCYQKIRDAAVSDDNTLRANALLLLGKLGNRNDMPLLYNALKDLDAQDKVHFQAVDSLAMMRDVKIYKAKLWPLLISKYADDRVMGIRGMGSLGTKEAIEAIETKLKDDVLEVRLAAAEELGKAGNMEGLDELIKYFQTNPDLNQSTMATGTAIAAIGKVKSSALTGYLAKALDSQSSYMRLVAAQSVLQMTP